MQTILTCAYILKLNAYILKLTQYFYREEFSSCQILCWDPWSTWNSFLCWVRYWIPVSFFYMFPSSNFKNDFFSPVYSFGTVVVAWNLSGLSSLHQWSSYVLLCNYHAVSITKAWAENHIWWFFPKYLLLRFALIFKPPYKFLRRSFTMINNVP